LEFGAVQTKSGAKSGRTPSDGEKQAGPLPSQIPGQTGLKQLKSGENSTAIWGGIG